MQKTEAGNSWRKKRAERERERERERVLPVSAFPISGDFAKLRVAGSREHEETLYILRDDLVSTEFPDFSLWFVGVMCFFSS